MRRLLTSTGVTAAALLALAGGPPAEPTGLAGPPAPPDESLTVLRHHATEILAGRGDSLARQEYPDPDAPSGVTIGDVAGTAAGTRLTVEFIGAEYPGTSPCGADYIVEAAESAVAVVLLVVADHHRARAVPPDEPPGICTQVGFMHSGTVTLSHPLGHRPVTDAVNGLPLPIQPHL